MQDSINSANSVQHYRVQVIETEASMRCGLMPATHYELVVQVYQIQLLYNQQMLFVWPFKQIRRYGYTSHSFSIEAGSKCATGEGLFIFRSVKSKQLYNQIIVNVAKIKQLQCIQADGRQSNIAHKSTNPNQDIAYGPTDISTDGCSCSAFQTTKSSLDQSLCHQANQCRDGGTIPHYIFNDDEYAQVVKK